MPHSQTRKHDHQLAAYQIVPVSGKGYQSFRETSTYNNINTFSQGQNQMVASLNSGLRLHESQSPTNKNQQYRRKSNKRMRGAYYQNQNQNEKNLNFFSNENFQQKQIPSMSNSPKKG